MIVSTDEVQTFTYGKDGMIKSWKSESKKFGNESAKYTWKNGKMIKKEGVRSKRAKW